QPAPAPVEEEKPAPEPVKEQPAPAPAEDKPAAEPVEEQPAPAPAEEKPVTAPVEKKPVSAPVVTAPVNPVVTVIAKILPLPVQPAAAVSQPVTESVDNKPAMTPVVKPVLIPTWADKLTGSQAPVRNSKVYVVQPGDTLETISQKTGVPVEAIKAANGISNKQASDKTPAGDTRNNGNYKPQSKPANMITYRVRGGESLYLIGKTLGIKYEDIMAANGLADFIIYPYQALVVPGIKMVDGTFDYIIKPRDTLYFIGKALGLDFTDIMVANGLTDSLIFPGQKLIIPDIDQATGVMAENNGQWQSAALRLAPVSDLAGDLELLARAVFAEARGESFEGQVAVAAVIVNRLEAAGFPKTIRDIIYQPGAFTAVDDGQINLEPDRTAYEAAQKALEGSDPSEGSLYYWNPDISTSRWIWTREIIKRIGNHLFGI
ncbi:MAG: cell wall hydrolase, partial [Bacillota bacterium]